jgi:DNA invertase Pin-like site-specific DNA recombinase
MNNQDKQKLTILYERLSVEDDRDTESQSIENQRAILQEYAERNGLTPFRHICDDGYSGTNWLRPGWQEVLSMVDAGEAACICIKDLSRMSRDYLHAGLDRQTFLEKGVRLIALNDNYDNSRGEDDFTPFKEIMSEWYARDISKKIKSVFQNKGRNGIPVSSKAPYGFYKDTADKNRWLVDDYAAGIVRRIFDLTVNGCGPFEIARILHDDKIEKPSVYLARVGHVNKPSALETANPYGWSSFTVSKIIESLSYLGHLVNFRYEKPSFKSKKFVERPKEDWLIFENHHDALVPPETWELAQKMRETKRRYDTTGEANPLTGLVFCHECGSKMYNHRGKSHVSHYVCGDYKNGKSHFAENHCSQHYVTSDVINAILLEVIQKTTAFVRQYEDKFIQMVREKSSVQQDETIKSHTRKIAKSERRIAELDKMFHSLYEDKVRGIISEERFLQMSKTCEQEQADLREQTAALQAEVDAWTEDKDNADSFVSLVRKYTRVEELTTPMMYEFVDKVVIHEAVWSEATETQKRKGTRSQQIDVYLKYIGNFDAPDIRSAEEIEAELKEEDRLARVRGYKRKYNRKKAGEKVAAEVKPAISENEIPEAASDIPKPAA